MSAAPIRHDAQLLRWIQTAKAAGLGAFKVSKRGREMILEVTPDVDPVADDLESKIQRMACNGAE